MGKGKCNGGLYLVTTDRLLTERCLLTAFRCRLRAGRAVPVQQSLLSEPSTLHVTPGGVWSTETINPVQLTKNQLVKQCGRLRYNRSKKNSLSFGRRLGEKSMHAKTESFNRNYYHCITAVGSYHSFKFQALPVWNSVLTKHTRNSDTLWVSS